MEQEMSLIKISEDFGYASTYFSKRFKLLFGENFASYLEKIRIQKAEELLTENIPMEKIAEMTGYNSVEVMRNAFRRSKGCTPGEWKKMHMKNQ